jgi:hypothetical protein
LLLVAFADALFFSGDDAADDERLVDEEELDDDDDDERLEADEELVPDELEPLELERDARLRFVFDGESLAFLIVSVSTVIFSQLIYSME